ncbi:unnamed protein product [Trifolium pratense]|uniref:Uncharacterized protein n=1 Tax=Trifolium pratense TaxID=57577 RepID=A0ACB0LPU0_TRIPR|nr:unnamed protein product [Trifolium pratense]
MMDSLCFSHDFKGTQFVIWQMKEFGVQDLVLTCWNWKSATPTPSTISVYDNLVGKFILIKDTSVIGEMVGDCSEEKEEPLISKELDSSDLSDSDSEDD